MALFIFFVVAVLLLAAFYGGVVVGIKDCKKQFNIPKNATGVCEDGKYKFY